MAAVQSTRSRNVSDRTIWAVTGFAFIKSSYAARLDFSAGQSSDIWTPKASAIALRTFLDLLLPSMTWYMLVRSHPSARAIAAPEIPQSIINFFIIFAVAFIMIKKCTIGYLKSRKNYTIGDLLFVEEELRIQ